MDAEIYLKQGHSEFTLIYTLRDRFLRVFRYYHSKVGVELVYLRKVAIKCHINRGWGSEGAHVVVIILDIVGYKNWEVQQVHLGSGKW